MHPKTIEEVLKALDRIIDTAIARQDPAGLFAYIYRRTTDQVRRAIAMRQFEDGPRMEAFDVAFANLYLEAYDNWQAGQATPLVWSTAFQEARRRHTIIQHILLGMNAHINYDLAIAASSLMKGEAIIALKRDFEKVNEILASIVDELQDRLGRVSPLMFLLDWIGQDRDESLINFSMAKARAFSWQLAYELWALDGQDYEERLATADHETAWIAQRIAAPSGWLLRGSLGLVQSLEPRDIGNILEALRR